MPRTKTIPFEQACQLAGGEDQLKKALDPNTNKPLFSDDWRNPRSRWYNYKSRGFPAYLILPIVIKGLEQPRLEREVTEAVKDLVKIHKSLGPHSKHWHAIRALLNAALDVV